MELALKRRQLGERLEAALQLQMGLRLGGLWPIVLGLHFPGTRVAAVRVGIGVRIRVGVAG